MFIFPCTPDGRRPLLKPGHNAPGAPWPGADPAKGGFHQARNAVDTVRLWWAYWPAAVPAAVVTPGTVVLDFDDTDVDGYPQHGSARLALNRARPDLGKLIDDLVGPVPKPDGTTNMQSAGGTAHVCQQSPESASIWTGRRPQDVGGQGWASSDKCPVWTGVRGAAVQAASPAKRGRSEATRLDGGEHTPKLSVGRCPGHHNILGSAPGSNRSLSRVRQQSISDELTAFRELLGPLGDELVLEEIRRLRNRIRGEWKRHRGPGAPSTGRASARQDLDG